jgi:GNAT superfamily N-acetyltransferase
VRLHFGADHDGRSRASAGRETTARGRLRLGKTSHGATRHRGDPTRASCVNTHPIYNTSYGEFSSAAWAISQLSSPILSTRGRRVLHYRTFRNTDPPRLVELWNQIFVGTGAVQLSGTSLLEFHVLAKPYFDPTGLLLALDDDQPVGFAHAGFGPNAEETALSTQTGITCLLGVIPVYRRSGIGTELLHRSEAYLRAKGARELYAGPSPHRNPFYLGLYGGSNSAGVLASDTAAGPFLLHHGYRPVESFLIWVWGDT